MDYKVALKVFVEATEMIQFWDKHGADNEQTRIQRQGD